MPYSEKTYFKLRTMLDSFEFNALAYCLHSKDDVEALERLEYIRSSLPMEELQNRINNMEKQESINHHCPGDKPFWCDGECCAHPCP